MKRELEPYQMIERSIIKKYRKELWTPFIVAVKRYELVQEGDKIAVCISGGKDSMLMAKLMQELQKHSDVPFELVFLVMDPGYNEINRQKIESNAELLHIPVTIFESNIFSVANNTEKNPCYLCARMRRGHLYSKAKELGCNKIALGHHFNDVIETTVMSMFYGSQMQAMPPKLHSTSFPGMTLIRPMYCIREEDILAWKRYNDLEFIQCACRFTENCTMCDNGGGGSKRQEVKLLLRRLRQPLRELLRLFGQQGKRIAVLQLLEQAVADGNAVRLAAPREPRAARHGSRRSGRQPVRKMRHRDAGLQLRTLTARIRNAEILHSPFRYDVNAAQLFRMLGNFADKNIEQPILLRRYGTDLLALLPNAQFHHQKSLPHSLCGRVAHHSVSPFGRPKLTAMALST